MHLPHIESLIEDGEVTQGHLHPVGCVAVANDEHNTLAMLIRRKGESLSQLLLRLDRAIANVQEGAIVLMRSTGCRLA